MTEAILGALGLVGGWIARGYLGAYLSRKAENLATKEDIAAITHEIESVKQEYSQQGERLRYELEATVQERGMRFARLHERRAEAMDGLYKRLVRTLGAFEPLAGTVKKAEDEAFQVKLDAAAEAAQELLTFFGEHRLYFDVGVIEGFEEISKALRTAWATFVLERIEGDWKYSDGAERKEQIELWGVARKTIRVEIPSLLGRLEETMRMQLGDESSSGASVVRAAGDETSPRPRE